MRFNQRQGDSTVTIGGQIKHGGDSEYYYFKSQDYLGAQLIINMMDAQRLSKPSCYQFDQQVLSQMCEGCSNIKQLKNYLEDKNLLVKDNSCYKLLDMNEAQRESFRQRFDGENSYELFEKFVDLVEESNKVHDFDQFRPSTEKKYFSLGPPKEGNPKFKSLPEVYAHLASVPDDPPSSDPELLLMHTGDILGLIQKYGIGKQSGRFSAREVWSSRAKTPHPYPRYKNLDYDSKDQVQRKKMCCQVLGPLKDGERCNIITGLTARNIVKFEMKRQKTINGGPVGVYSIVSRASDALYKCHESRRHEPGSDVLNSNDFELDRSFRVNANTDARSWVRRADNATTLGFGSDNEWSGELVPKETNQTQSKVKGQSNSQSKDTSPKHSEVMMHLTNQSICGGWILLQFVYVEVSDNAQVASVSLYEGDTLSPATPNILRLLHIQAEVYRKFGHIMKLKLDAGNDGVTTITPEVVKYHLCDQALGNPGDIRTNLLQKIISDGLAKSLYTIYKREIWVYLLEIADKNIPKPKNLNKFLLHSGIIPDVHGDIDEAKVWRTIKVSIEIFKRNLVKLLPSEEGHQTVSGIDCGLFSDEYRWCFDAIMHGWDAKCSTFGMSYISVLWSRLGSKGKANKIALHALLLHALESNAVLSFSDLALSHRLFNNTLSIDSPCFSPALVLFPAYIYLDCLKNNIKTYFSMDQMHLITKWIYGAKYDGRDDLERSFSAVIAINAINTSSDILSSPKLPQISNNDPIDQLFRVFKELCEKNPASTPPVRGLIELLILNLKNANPRDKLKGLRKLAKFIEDELLKDVIKGIESHILEQHIEELIEIASDQLECLAPLSVIIKYLIKGYASLCVSLMDNTGLSSFFSSIFLDSAAAVGKYNTEEQKAGPIKRDQFGALLSKLSRSSAARAVGECQMKEEGADQREIMREIKSNCMYAMLQIADYYSCMSDASKAKATSNYVLLGCLLQLDLEEELFTNDDVRVINSIAIILRLAHFQGAYESSALYGNILKYRLTVTTLKLLSKFVSYREKILSILKDVNIISVRTIDGVVEGACSMLEAMGKEQAGSCMKDLSENEKPLIDTVVDIISLLKNMVKQKLAHNAVISPCVLNCLKLAMFSNIDSRYFTPTNDVRLQLLTLLLNQIDMPVEYSKIILSHLYSVVTIPDLSICDDIVDMTIALLDRYANVGDEQIHSSTPSEKIVFDMLIFDIFNHSLGKSISFRKNREAPAKNYLHRILSDLNRRRSLMSLLCRKYNHVISVSRSTNSQRACVEALEPEMFANEAEMFANNLMSSITKASVKFRDFMGNQEVRDLMITYYAKLSEDGERLSDCLTFASRYIDCYPDDSGKIVLFTHDDDFFNHLYTILLNTNLSLAQDYSDAWRVMAAFIRSLDGHRIESLSKGMKFRTLCKTQKYFNYNPQLIYHSLINDPTSVYELDSNFLESCIDAWIIMYTGRKNQMSKKYSPYAIRSINIILRSYSDFSPCPAKYKDIALKVLVFLSFEYTVLKTLEVHDSILLHLKKIVQEYFLNTGNTFNSGASVSAAGGGSSIDAALQFFQAQATKHLRIGQRITITGLTQQESLKYNRKKAIIIGFFEDEGIERYKVCIDGGNILGFRYQHLEPLSGEHEIYYGLLHCVLRLEHTIKDARPDLQLLSRDDIKILVNKNKEYTHAYFNFMQRLYAEEKNTYGINNLKVYKRLRIIPVSCTQNFLFIYKAHFEASSGKARARIAAKLGKNLLSLNIKDVTAVIEYIDTSLRTNERGRCVETFDLLAHQAGLVSLMNVGASDRVESSAQNSSNHLPNRSDVFAHNRVNLPNQEHTIKGHVCSGGGVPSAPNRR